MKALITGASSGLGRDMAKILSERGYDIIAVARRKERLEELKKELKTNVEIMTSDVSDVHHCMEIAKRAKEAFHKVTKPLPSLFPGIKPCEMQLCMTQKLNHL